MFDQIMKIVSAVTPFLLLIMGWIYTSTTKKRDKRDQSNMETEKKREEERRKQIDEQTEKIGALANEISDLKNVMEKAHAVDVATNAKINALADAGNITSTKVSNLASLVMTLAEGLRDQHLDGNITKAVEKYRNFEMEQSNAMLHNAYESAKDDSTQNK